MAVPVLELKVFMFVAMGFMSRPVVRVAVVEVIMSVRVGMPGLRVNVKVGMFLADDKI
jgi:hypothetical protein